MNMHDVASPMGFDCEGTPLPVGGGTWIGHVIPGIFFMLWGLHWMQANFLRHIKSQSTGQLFTARPWFWLSSKTRWLYGAESFLKILSGPIGLSVELYFDDKNGMRPLYCQDGQFAIKYAHNYQHASMYPAFMISGIVDFIGMRVRLPPGTETVFVGAAFLSEGALMLAHKKHLPLDASLHTMLGICMLATAVGCFAELRAPHTFLISTFKSFGLTMHGLWMIVMGQMLFAGSKAWTDDYSGPAMLAPPFFALLAVTVAFLFLLTYICIDLCYQRSQKYTSLPLTTKPSDDSDLHRVFSNPTSVQDSALEHSDDGLVPQDNAGSLGLDHIKQPRKNVLDNIRLKLPNLPGQPSQKGRKPEGSIL